MRGRISSMDSDNRTLEYFAVGDKLCTHKQIEFRDGRVFMRMKQRVMKTPV